MVGQSAACGLAALALALQGAAAQSLFGGGATGAASSKCSLASYETRSAEVNDVCCPDPAMCATGLPDICDLDCAVIFMNYHADCNGLLLTLQGQEVSDQLERFNEKCINRYDVPQLLKMIRRMSLEGCSADAALDADIDKVKGKQEQGLAETDGVAGHFAVELGSCDYEGIQAKIDAVDRACCRAGDKGDQCEGGVPSACDLECAIHYVPFHEDCNAILQGTFGANMGNFDALYGQCMMNSRRDVSGLLRTMYLTNEQFDSDTCPVEAALNYNADCPGGEPECMMEYMGVDPDLSAQSVNQFYRLFVTENFGATSMCIYEWQLLGPNGCLWDMRDISRDMKDMGGRPNTPLDQQYMQIYTDSLNLNPSGYGPGNCFDDSLTPLPAGGVFCTLSNWAVTDTPGVAKPAADTRSDVEIGDMEEAGNWVAVNFTVPVEITGFRIRANGWNTAPKNFYFQGAPTLNGPWTTIDHHDMSMPPPTTQRPHPWLGNEMRQFWVGVPSEYPGIKPEIYDAFNANPYGFTGSGDRTDLCAMPEPNGYDGGH